MAPALPTRAFSSSHRSAWRTAPSRKLCAPCRPSLVVDGGVVTELDGKPADAFDVIDEFIARYGIDLTVADEAMALDDAVLARMAVDVNVPRAEVVLMPRAERT